MNPTVRQTVVDVEWDFYNWDWRESHGWGWSDKQPWTWGLETIVAGPQIKCLTPWWFCHEDSFSIYSIHFPHHALQFPMITSTLQESLKTAYMMIVQRIGGKSIKVAGGLPCSHLLIGCLQKQQCFRGTRWGVAGITGRAGRSGGEHGIPSAIAGKITQENKTKQNPAYF